MTTTISSPSTTLTPALVDGYTSARTSGNIVHAILGSTEPAVTLRPAGMRAGKLRIVVGTSRALCQQFEQMLAGGTVLTISDTSVDVGMSFVVVGEIEAQLDDDTRAVWIIEAGFQEVAP